MAKNQVKKPHGQLRRSQVVTTFGPGAMVDLPDHSILISGLDQWTGANEEMKGTLGGLIQEGRRIQEHMRQALTRAELCSNDPVCAQHQPDNLHERRFLHGAACHGCLLIAETSCEQQNDYLDRSLVVPTVENRGVEFFKMDT